MSDPKQPETPDATAFYVTDLTTYATDLDAFETYLREHVRSDADVSRLLREFDEEQQLLWKDRIVEDDAPNP